MRVESDLALLHPNFRARVELLLAHMRARGHRPVAFETRRSFERAAELARRGTGVSRSMHCYGIAVDIVDGLRATKEESLWTALPEFWRDLELGAHAHGLVWGGRFARADKPHVQAVPVALQATVRQASPAELDRLIRARLPLDGAPAPAHRPTPEPPHR